MKTLLLVAAIYSFGGSGATVEWQGPDPLVQQRNSLPLCVDGPGVHLNYDAAIHEFSCGK